MRASEAYDLIKSDSSWPRCWTPLGVAHQFKGRTVTYSRKIFYLSPTSADRCGYCTFRKDPGELGVWTMSPSDIDSVLVRGMAAGCKER
jgi:2-iminoacetate synthase ThiH